jgi:tetratricopeptide (TPR) repeat protein
VVDCGAPPASAAVAYLYVGRLLLDGEQPRRAVMPLTRATQWSAEGEIRTKAVLGLAAAHLLNGHPETANDVLMDFRSDVESQSRLAAFISALARYRAVNHPTRRLYEGQALLTALDPVDTGDFFGRYSWYLRGRAYEDLLLPEMAVEVYRESLAAEEHPPYHDAIVYGLASCLVDIGDLEGARLQLTGLMENSAPEWQRKAAFRLCRLQLDGDEALAASRTARMLVDQCTTQQDKVQALELLGEAFQQMGDHAAAALCFAGTVPGEASPTEKKEQ